MRTPKISRIKQILKPYELFDKNETFVRMGTAEDAKRLGLWRRVVHIFVFNPKGELLVCKRPSTSRAYPNLITSSAGGHVEPKESYKKAAARELKEELGLQTALRDLKRFDVVSRNHGKVIHRLFVTRASRYHPLAREIASSAFRPIPFLVKDVRMHPKRYTLSFRNALAHYLATRR